MGSGKRSAVEPKMTRLRFSQYPYDLLFREP
jgi:hypothetical protein